MQITVTQRSVFTSSRIFTCTRSSYLGEIDDFCFANVHLHSEKKINTVVSITLHDPFFLLPIQYHSPKTKIYTGVHAPGRQPTFQTPHSTNSTDGTETQQHSSNESAA